MRPIRARDGAAVLSGSEVVSAALTFDYAVSAAAREPGVPSSRDD
jgi:hypothetical protein